MKEEEHKCSGATTALATVLVRVTTQDLMLLERENTDGLHSQLNCGTQIMAGFRNAEAEKDGYSCQCE